MGRAKLYEIARRYPKIFRRFDGCTLLDLKYLNQIIAKCPTGTQPGHHSKARAA
jgi:hypothetical protein